MDTALDPDVCVLHAQVRAGDPEMRIDEGGRLRHANFPGAEGSLFLGDVTDALLRCLGPHEPPRVVEKPGFDQQRWTLQVSTPEVEIRIESRAYWGFGLFASCFLNRFEMSGPLTRRARLVFDLCAALGRNPWEGRRKGGFNRAAGDEDGSHRALWEAMIERGRADIAMAIDAIRTRADALQSELPALADEAPEGWEFDLALEEVGAARAECDVADDALHDRSATGVERALARAENHLIEADPRTEVVGQFERGDVLDAMAAVEADEVDISDTVLVMEELPEDSSATDDIPFVDLSEEE